MKTIAAISFLRRQLPILCASLASVLVVGSFVFAQPTQFPPGGNTPTPLNGSSEAQTKSGVLNLDGGLTANSLSANQANIGNLCLPGGCRNSWPTANYTTPTLNQVLDVGNTSNRPIDFSQSALLSWQYTPGRNTWYDGRLDYGTSGCAYRPIQYLTWTYCPSGQFVKGTNLNTSPPQMLCCPVQMTAF